MKMKKQFFFTSNTAYICSEKTAITELIRNYDLGESFVFFRIRIELHHCSKSAAIGAGGLE